MKSALPAIMLSLIACTGPAGPAGAAGPVGPVGPQGPQGAAGAMGTPGAAIVVDGGSLIAGPGIVLANGVISLPMNCAAGQVLQWSGSSWVCTTLSSSGGGTSSNANGGNLVNWSNETSQWLVDNNLTVALNTTATDVVEGESAFTFTSKATNTDAFASHNELIPVDGNRILMGRVSVKLLAGTGSFQAGVVAFDRAKQALNGGTPIWFIGGGSLSSGTQYAFSGNSRNAGPTGNQLPAETRFIKPVLLFRGSANSQTVIDGLFIGRDTAMFELLPFRCDINPSGRTADFWASGGQLRLSASGSAFHGVAGALMGMLIKVDGTLVGGVHAFTNEALSHKVLTSRLFTVSLSPGKHTLSLEAAAGTLSDANDCSAVIAQEL